jgi:hypothetical protein
VRHLEVRTGELNISRRLTQQYKVARRESARRVAFAVSRRVAALLIAGMASTACYRYAPIPLAAVAAKDEVRVRITQDAAARLSKDLGSYSTELDGQLSSQGPDSVALGVPIDRAYRGVTVGTTTQQLFLGRSEVVEVRKREFSRGRTVLLSAGAVVGFGLLVGTIAQLGDPNPNGDDHATLPPPSTSRAPLGYHLRIRIPLP